MSLITRQAKGSKLTIQEMDGNLTYLEALATGSTPQELSTVLATGNETDGNNIIMSDNDVINAENGGGQLDLRYGADNVVMLSTDAGGFNEQGLNLEAGYVSLFDYSGGGYLELYGEFVELYADNFGTALQLGPRGFQIYDSHSGMFTTPDPTLSVDFFNDGFDNTLVLLNKNKVRIAIRDNANIPIEWFSVEEDKITLKTLNIIADRIPTYVDNAAAVADGHPTDAVYKTSTGELRIVV
jgi:hypothetical protein